MFRTTWALAAPIIHSGWTFARHGDIEGTAAPARNDEYLLFQNLIATWPAELTLPRAAEASALTNYSSRLQAAMIKSLREARVYSNWMSPDTVYENAVTEFVRDAVDPAIALTFLENFLPFQQHIAQLGVHNSLAQVLLKIASPGVADFYQGSDLWDLNLPDPDNRRPVNLGERRSSLNSLAARGDKDRRTLFRELLENWHDGTIKLAIIQILLNFTRQHPMLFENGQYEAVQLEEAAPWPACAFVHQFEQQSCLVLASLDPRITCGGNFPRATLDLGSQKFTEKWHEVITGRVIPAGRGSIALSDVFGPLPIALLIPTQY